MKTQLRFSIKVLIAFALTACSQSPMSNQRQEFNAKAGSKVESYVNTISNSLRPATTAGRGIRGIAYGGAGTSLSSAFDIFSYGGNNPFGGYILPQTMEQDRTGCAQLISQIPPIAEYYAPAMATLARCLNRVLNYRNPILTWSMTQFDSRALDRWSYAVDYTRVAPYGAYGGYAGTFGGFVLGGILQGDR